MKKILAIALTLTLILALAVMPTSAATLSANWTEIWNMVDGEGCGELIVDNNGAIYFDNEVGGFASNIAAVYGEKVKVDGLEMHLNLENLFTGADVIWLPGSLGPIVTVGLSADKATTYVPYSINDGKDESEWVNPMAGNKTGLDTKVSSTAACTFVLVDNATDYGIFGGMQSAIKIGFDAPVKTAVKSGEDFLLKFVVDGENVKILVNGEETGVTFLAADVLDADGKAYLAFTSTSHGGAHTGLTVKYINGQAANSFDGAEGSCAPITPSEPETPSEPAPSEPESSIVITPPAENKGGCGNNA